MSFCNYIPCFQADDGTFEKRPFAAWTKYQSRRYNQAIPPEIPRGIICGDISDGLEVLDFDNHGGECLFNRWAEIVENVAPSLLSKLTIETTPSGGFHVYLRCLLNEKNQKLANNEHNEAMIETRGVGGFIVCAPSRGYVLQQGTFEDAPTITREQRELLFSVARSFDRGPKKETQFSTGSASDETTPADVLRKPEARDVIRAALENVGFVPIYKRGNDEYFGNRNAARATDTKAVLSDSENFVYCFASNHIGPLTMGANTPLTVYAACNNLTIADAARNIRQMFPSYFPTVSKPAAPVVPFVGEIEEQQTPRFVGEQFFEKNRELFPRFIVDAVDAYEKRTNAPQKTLYAFNLLSLVGLFLDTKTRVRGDVFRTRLNCFSIAETASGKDGVRVAMKRLFIHGVEKRYYSRGAVIDKKLSTEEAIVKKPAPRSFVENITSASSILYALAESATADREQRENEKSAANYKNGIPQQDGENVKGRAVCYFSIDEAADVLSGSANRGNDPRAQAFALLKRVTECAPNELITLDDAINQKSRLLKAGLDSEIVGPSVSCSFFAPFGVEEHLKTSDFAGGFVNRFAFIIGEKRNDVIKNGMFRRHNPSDVTPTEFDLIARAATAERVELSLDDSVAEYADEQIARFRSDVPEDQTSDDATARLYSRAEALVVLSAYLNANNFDVLTESGTAATCDNYENAFAAFTEEGNLQPDWANLQPNLQPNNQTISVERRDVDFAIACLNYFKNSILFLCSRTTDETTDKKTNYDFKVERAILSAVKSSRNGLTAASLYSSPKYGLKPYKMTRGKLLAFLDELVRTNALVVDEKGRFKAKETDETKK